MSEAQAAAAGHVLFLLPKSKALPAVPCKDVAAARLKRRGMKAEELAKSPLAADLPGGGLAVWAMVDEKQSPFERHVLIRKALQALTGERPQEIALAVFGSEAQRRQLAEDAVLVALLNAPLLPLRKSKDERKALKKIALHGWKAGDGFALQQALAEGSVLTRALTLLPANELTPKAYREQVRKLAKDNGWGVEEFDMKKLRKLGAGAFVAVAQGSGDEEAAIVRLSYRPKGAKKTVALVGKGICFDTGGHNLKPARYMHGMHEDMNGSAVVLGILLAATRLKLPVALDAWLALAQNHISPAAYKQNDVITALNGTTIEIVHTDAEGRMVLADTLALAAKEKPAAIVDFATLTGSMAVALGARYSGVLSNQEELAAAAVKAGKAAGERVCAFPLDADYEEGLESKIADIKQCTMDSEADHILAGRFLLRFVGDLPWLHVDLSASRCDGGLGAVASDVTGFGVGLGVELLRSSMI
ncbi:MAG: leucyl aminopeptidase family protein [Sulfuricellaceae bacterium]